MAQRKKKIAQKPQQVRGSELREKMQESYEKGREYRDKNQGQDVLNTRVHNAQLAEVHKDKASGKRIH